MLKLKKLQLQGFKSFCDRTEVTFDGHGVAAIVGPNGCGKSNLADAIAWVLGEQSAKSLRGARMEDVIFAGSRERPATGYAEVSLTLVNPAEYEPESEADPGVEAADDGAWEPPAEETAAAAGAASGGAIVLSIRPRRRAASPARRGEVTVTRRLYRDGTSEYAMNGKLCRLRDIHELFLGTGLGPDCYAILSQGHIEQILSSKPHDRRAVIEEAAGVSKYKVRRRLAEAKLEQARQNLNRVNDIFEEVTRQVGSLKRQAAKAERYQGLKREYDRKQRATLQARALAWQAQWEALEAERQRMRAEVEAAQAALAGAESARGAAAHERLQLEQALREASEAGARLLREIDRAVQQLSFQEQQQRELAHRAGEMTAERTRLEAQHAHLAAELGAARAEAEASAAALAEAGAAVAAAEAEWAGAHAGVTECEGALERARASLLERMSQAATLSNRRAQCDAQRQSLEQQQRRWQASAAAVAAELAAARERRTVAADDQQRRLQSAHELGARQSAAVREAAEARQRELDQRQACESLRARLAEVAARRHSLEELVAHHGYGTEAVKKLFQEGGGEERFQPLGLLAEYLDVDARYEPVIEEFLREELNYVVVRTWDQAGAGVERVRHQAEGRATFLVETPAVGESAADTAPVAEPGVVALADEVRLANGFRGRLDGILPRLRHAYLVEDRAQAQRLAETHRAAYFLTRQGECFHACTVTAGALAGTGPLRVKRELGERLREESSLAAARTAGEEALAAAVAAAAEAREQLERLNLERFEAEKQLLTSSQAARQAEADEQRLSEQSQLLESEGRRHDIERAQLEAELARLGQAAEAAEVELAQWRGLQQAAAERTGEARARQEAAAATRAAAQQERARREERARGAGDSQRRLEHLTADLSRRIAEVGAEKERTDARQAELLVEHAALERRLAADRAAGVDAAARQQQCERSLAAAVAHIETLEADAAAHRAQLEARRQCLNERDIAAARLEADLQHLADTCRQELGCELEALAAEPPAEEITDLAVLEEAARALKMRIENLGPINMVALEEYEEARQRHAFLDTQRQDLLQSIADTQKAIGEIDAVSRQQFEEAFARINAHFQETFRTLFGGGQGMLQLSTLEGQDEAGVDLIAQPPGKKLQNVLLLSGGEKAMTAMALLLAIFRYHPSPFCLLDEADAAMDEANVGRFGAMIRDLSDATQFILITHNKRTMESASALYGVTMPQPGVSRLVSVNLQERERQAAG